ncbi:MAG TPA: hypothetical protein VMF69_12525 [Gemmataceae bacterium]|nr:hypothetical protein [Gemmataceae bacterium]
MTETEWQECISPELMLAHLGERASLRKRRLFACASVRRVWLLLGDDRLRQAVKVAERFADGRVAAKVVDKARQLARRLREERETVERREATWMARAARAAAQAVESLLPEQGPILIAPRDVRDAPDVVSATRTARTAARAAEAQCEKDSAAAIELIRRLPALDAVDLLREIFGNPFRSTGIDPRWLDWKDDIIPKMARVIYRKRCFRNLPILADALEDAGCRDPAILMHCRAPVDHARGCWVVDAVLGMT